MEALSRYCRRGQPQREARARAAQVDLFDEAGDLGRHRARNRRRGDAPGAHPLRDEAGGDGRERGRDGEASATRAQDVGERRKQGQRDAGGDERRLAVGGEREDRARAGRHRQPEGRAAEGVFLLQRGGELFAQGACERGKARAQAPGGLAFLLRMTYGDLRHAPNPSIERVIETAVRACPFWPGPAHVTGAPFVAQRRKSNFLQFESSSGPGLHAEASFATAKASKHGRENGPPPFETRCSASLLRTRASVPYSV
ncbi:MAG: hypothetical protein V9G24_17415 [Rhodoblastus sp.]